MSVVERTDDARRLRIGLLVPSTNTVMEPDLAAAFAGVATVHTARMPLADVTREAERAMIATAPAAAATLGGIGLRSCVFGCTSAAAILGAAAAETLCDELTAACGAPVLSVVDSVVARLRAYAARRVAVYTPYDETLTAAVADEVAAAGFEVASADGSGLTDNTAIGAVQPAALTDAVVARLAGTDADAVFVSCTNLRAVEARGALATALGVPVVTSNSAVIDRLGAELGIAGRPAVAD